MSPEQLTLPLGFISNQNLFSNHWLASRLAAEPEFLQSRNNAATALEQIASLWKRERNRVANYSEQGLEYAFIQPTLEHLGWKLVYQTYLEGRKPDYALFCTEEEMDRALPTPKTLRFWQPATMVADAKSWNLNLDRPSTVHNQREYPPQQIEWYLDKSRCDYGLLTNAHAWRLYPRNREPYQPRFETYYQFNLTDLLEQWLQTTSFTDKEALLDDFLSFYLFFSPIAYTEVLGHKSLILRARDGSSEYRLGVGEQLKQRAFEALRLCIEGFLTLSSNALDAAEHLYLVREQSFVFLYRLLFTMFAEDRQLLPYGVNRTYTNNRSLRRLRDNIATYLDQTRDQPVLAYSRTETSLYADLLDLFDLIDRGNKTYGVPAYNGGLFDNEEHPFLLQKALSNWYVANIVDCLGRALDSTSSSSDLFRVDYRDLAIQHLGAIYEGLLELQPHFASETLRVIAENSGSNPIEKIQRTSEPVPHGFHATGITYQPGEVYLLTNKGERKATGSYYTPDHIVTYIVEQTLGPLCVEISDALVGELEQLAALPLSDERTESMRRLQSDFDDRVLNLRVLDPAMGSGHFLIGACKYLAEEIATHPYTFDQSAAYLSDESALAFWKRRVAESCLFGVDVNPLAVELAKLALWLETVASDKPLAFLDHHFHSGDSLIGTSVETIGTLPGEIELRKDTFQAQLAERMPKLLEPLRQIASLGSNTTQEVKTKTQLFKSYERTAATLRQLADLWCASFLPNGSRLVQPLDYQNAIDLIDHPKKFSELIQGSKLASASEELLAAGILPFHFWLEFPEVFFPPLTGKAKQPGFDAVIGNPPYDVLSALETGKDLTYLQNFIEFEPTFAPSQKGKNNLYKLFICRGIHLLRTGGRIGHIVPMPLLGDEQAFGVRQLLLTTATPTAIEAFPQKDDVRNRVFEDAKLSTCIFIALKVSTDKPFRSRVHPGRTIEESSPSLLLRPSQVKLYDPNNQPIVACSQDDWDLAVKIVSNGRMRRLGDFCTAYQGEVNETTDGKKGNISYDPKDGPQVLRGSNICLYVLRPPSQGEPMFLRKDRYLDGKKPSAKAWHHRHPRVGLQESSPQNNFRRIIASFIPEGEFCNHKINYFPETEAKLPLNALLALLNSKLSDWYFRLASTSASVSHYQLYNLPVPNFASPSKANLPTGFKRALDSRNFDKVFDLVVPLTTTPPFSFSLVLCIGELADQIIVVEKNRGDIARSERSALAPDASEYQKLIDRILYRTAGLTDDEATHLEERLSSML